MENTERRTPKIILNIAFTPPHPPDKASMEERQKHKQKRDFYTCKSSQNVVKYTAQDDKKQDEDDTNPERKKSMKELIDELYEKVQDRYDNQQQDRPNTHYDGKDGLNEWSNMILNRGEKPTILKYANNYKKTSGGIFGSKSDGTVGYLDGMDRVALETDMQLTQSIVWHGVVSFEENFGKSLDEKSVKSMMTKQMKLLLKDSHLDENNVNWYASVHHNTDNLHCHFFFFEKEQKKINSKGELVFNRKGTISMRAIDNMLVRMNDFFAKSKDLYTVRNKVLEKVKENSDHFGENILADIKKLALKLPKEGRLQYNSSNMKPLLPKVNKLVQDIISSDQEINAKYLAFESWKKQREKQIVDILGARQQTDLIAKVQNDINERLGNVVIKSVVRLRDKYEWIENKRLERLTNKKPYVKKGFSDGNTSKKVVARQKRIYIMRELKRLFSSMGRETESVIRMAEQRFREIERELVAENSNDMNE